MIDIFEENNSKKKEIENIIYNENLYKILKVNENATQEKITHHFRELAKILHPDKGGNSSEFNELVIAYRILGNKRRREIYDNKYSKRNNELKNESINHYNEFRPQLNKNFDSRNFNEDFKNRENLLIKDNKEFEDETFDIDDNFEERTNNSYKQEREIINDYVSNNHGIYKNKYDPQLFNEHFNELKETTDCKELIIKEPESYNKTLLHYTELNNKKQGNPITKLNYSSYSKENIGIKNPNKIMKRPNKFKHDMAPTSDSKLQKKYEQMQSSRINENIKYETNYKTHNDFFN